MLGHGAKFGHKMEQAIAALLSNRNVEEAARAIGISANTLLRWAKDLLPRVRLGRRWIITRHAYG